MISIVVPVYNLEDYLSETIQSVQSQTLSDWEMIVVDDASTDDSYAIACAAARKDSRITVLQNSENLGVAATRNRGIAAVQGEYIAMLDADDLWEPHKLERQLAQISQGYDLVFSSYDFVDASGRPLRRPGPFIVPERVTYRSMLVNNTIGHSSVMARAALMKQHPFRPDTYHEDYVLWLELFAQGISAFGDQDVLMHYRLREGSRSRNKRTAARKRWEVYRKVLHLSLWKSLALFVNYACVSVRKYFF